MNPSIETFYSQKAGEYDVQLKVVTNKAKRFAWYRFFTFLAIFAPLFIFGLKSWFTLFFSLAAIILFFFLIKKNIEFEKSKKKIQVLKKLVDDELLALNHKFLHFKNGSQFLNTDHFFSYDLDLFGEGSLFQFINRTSTVSGEQKLAGWFIKPPLGKDEIAGKQEAVRELSQIPEWRLNFLAEGQMFEETSLMHDEILSWAGLDLKFKNAVSVKRILFVIPLLTLISIAPAAFGITNLFVWIMVL
ncbi:MAG TPA: hypothetical protein VLQ91_14420, partial [Draconibacterium sp.]|nr:hypothetical protein [Draconibacterium sp.]